MEGETGGRTALSIEEHNALVIFNDLVRLVVRGFYADECSPMMDMLLREFRAIPEDDMARTLKLHPRQVRQHLSKLKEDHVLRTIIKKEDKLDEFGKVIPNRNWAQQVFWYIDYKHFVDALKYRVYMMNVKAGEHVDHNLMVQLYRCTRCNKEYSANEADRLLDLSTGVMKCEELRCRGAELEEKDTVDMVDSASQRQAALAEQLKPILDCLKRVDELVAPKVDLSHCFSSTTAVDGDAASHEEAAKARRLLTGVHTQEQQVTVNMFDPSEAGAGAQRVEERRVSKAMPTFLLSKSAAPLPAPVEPSAADALRRPTSVPAAVAAAVSLSVKSEVVELSAPPPVALSLPSLEEVPQSMEDDMWSHPEQPSAAPALAEPTAIAADSADMFEPPPERETAADGAFEEPASDMFEEPTATSGADGDPLVKIGDRMVPVSEVTEEDKAMMTPEEYKAYFELLSPFLE